MSDIVVVDNTAILRGFPVIGGTQEVHLVSVPYIRGIQRSPEVRVGLVLVVTSGIVIVQVKAHSQLLACIDTEFGIDMVFTVLLVTTVVIADVGIGRQRVQVQEVLRFLGGIVIGIRKDKLAEGFPVYEDTVQSRGIVVTDGVIFSKHSGVIDAVLVKVWHGVQLRLTDISEFPVHRPGPYPFGHLLVVLDGISFVGVECAIFITLCDIAGRIHLIIHLSLRL